MKIGIYGGTFDPPHNGHVHACKCFYDTFYVDKLMVIPTAIPPHKIQQSKVEATARLEMVKLAFQDIGNRIEISDVELKRKGKSYTKDTIKYLLDNGANEILLLCGTDMFVTLDTWVEFEYIFNNAIIVCIRRETDEHYEELIKKKSIKYKEDYDAKIEFINVSAVEISSSEIRENIDKEYIKSLIPEKVYKFIIERGLYK